MIFPAAVALGAQLFMPAIPVSDNVPVLNVEPVCDGIARQGGVSFRDPQIAKEKKNCIDSEHEVRGEIAKVWSSFNSGDKNICINEARRGGESSYTELLTCLEMARDVRQLRKEQGSAGGTINRTR